jgi:hypothetical protein
MLYEGPLGKTWPVAAEFLAYLESCSTARAHNRSGSRSPCFANSMISLATAIVAGSARSTSPSLLSAASKAADKLAMSSGPNA